MKMDFIKKTELFFIQLQYCLTIEPEPILEGDKGHYSLMLKPDTFLKLINDFQIEYPFIPENKIIELKGLINKENIKTEDALKIIENYKKQYWVLDTVIMFDPVTNKIKRTLKSIDSNISEKEINIELFNYQKHLQAKREKFYIDLINEIQGLPHQQAKTITEQETVYGEIAKKYEKKFGHAIPFGAFVFDDLKKVVEIVEPVELRLVEYKKILHFWVNTSLTDSNLIGETEISNRLIPLIENEIYLLEQFISKPNQQTEIKNIGNLDDLFKDINDSNYGDLELFKIIKQETNLGLVELNFIKKDLELYINIQREELISNISDIELKNKIEDYKKKSKKIPYKTIKQISTNIEQNTNIKKSFSLIDIEVIDLENFFFPFELYNLYRLNKIIDKEIEKHNDNHNDNNILYKNKIVKEKNQNNEFTFENFLNKKNQNYILKILEDLSITFNGTLNLSTRKKGAIRGVIIALRDNNILPQLSLETLIKNIASKIGLEINSKLDSTKISDEFEKKAKKYIKENPF